MQTGCRNFTNMREDGGGEKNRWEGANKRGDRDAAQLPQSETDEFFLFPSCFARCIHVREEGREEDQEHRCMAILLHPLAKIPALSFVLLNTRLHFFKQ